MKLLKSSFKKWTAILLLINLFYSTFSEDNSGFSGFDLPTQEQKNPSKQTSSKGLAAPEQLSKPKSDTAKDLQEAAERSASQQTTALSRGNQLAQKILADKSSTSSPEQKASILSRRHTKPSVTQSELEEEPSTAGAKQVTFQSKKSLPQGADLVMKHSLASFTYMKQKPNPFKPNGGITSNGALNSKYHEFIDSVHATPGFLPIFTKLHLVALHQIYEYLMGVYASLNMTHIDDIESYVTLESIYGLNKKTLIVNHLVSVIEAQLNQALVALFPGMKNNYATHGGMTCINADKVSRVDLLVIDVERVVYETFKTAGITPDQWHSVLNGLKNPDYTEFLTKLPQDILTAVGRKIESYLQTSMDIGGTNDYIKNARVIFTEEPQKSLFGGKVPSAANWQKAIEDLASKTSDTTKFPHYISLFKQLSHEEKEILIDALDILLAHFSSNQRLEDLSTLIPMLEGATPTQDLSVGQYTLLLNVMKTITYAGPVKEAITTMQEIYTDLVAANVNPLTSQQKKVLEEVVCYLLLRLEKGSAAGINKTVAKVQKLLANPDAQNQLSSKEKSLVQQWSGFTQLEKGELKIIAGDIWEDHNHLERLTDNDKKLLIDGLAHFATVPNKTFTKSEKSFLTEIADHFTNEGLHASLLSEDQLNTYNKVIAYFKSDDFYIQENYTFSQAEQDMHKLFDKSKFDAVTAPLAHNTIDYLDKRTPSELVMLLGAFQASGRVAESRINKHQAKAAAFGHIFETEPELRNELYLAVNTKQYQHLVGVNQQIAASTEEKPFTLSQLSPPKRLALAHILTLLVIPDKALPKLGSIAGDTSDIDPMLDPASPEAQAATEKAAQSSAEKNPTHANTAEIVKIGYLQLIEKHHLQSPVLSTLIDSVNVNDYEFLQNLFQKKIAHFNFELPMLSADQKKYITTVLRSYQDILTKTPSEGATKVPSSQTKEKGLKKPTHPLSQEDHINIGGVVPILHGYTHLIQMQESFNEVLGKYLHFFTPYTATLKQGLKEGSKSTAGNKYSGLTTFAHYAKSIKDMLGGTKMETINPPLFFYNEESMRGIQLIPVLAKTVEGTHNVPYPTFGVNAALSQKPLDADHVNNNEIMLPNGNNVVVPSLTVTWQGTEYSPRFFLKDEYGNPRANDPKLNFPAITAPTEKGGKLNQQVHKNAAIPWLEKKSVPIEDTADATHFPYVYTPAMDASGNRIKPKGEEGLYANIPMISHDPVKKDNVLIRLYEQPILPQPDWLNSEEGIITMLRVCLGDFTSALYLDDQVFDSCLEFIFRKALSTQPNLPDDVPSHRALDTSEATLKHLSEECHLHLVREFIDEKTHQKAAEEINLKTGQIVGASRGQKE